ncbi:NPCBM/NEW2 domain-containing protein [Propioniciclava sp.]|uniref:NPCBM/NEW2 domain-containing protein n=1 Tax=Propioniciclava sp. TaxID=2038686 RepID=UPI002607954A|nr:NPCBM/NEW2 domain-containing protein [Propioniciclava sp.]
MSAPPARARRPLARRWLATLCALVLALTLVPTQGARASTVDPSLAPTPYQGWNTYYGLGVDFTEAEIIEMAQAMIDRGLLAAGYDIVWLDGGWAAPGRDADGNLIPDPEQFPNGLKHLTDTLHAMGFRAGIYTDAGPMLPTNKTCTIGSGGGYQQQDADQFARWGFDAVKVDFLCGWENKLDPETEFRKMAEAIRNNSEGRPMVFNLCNPVTSPYWGEYPEHMQSIGSWAYAPEIAESWRTYTDVGWVGKIQFADVLRNYDANARHPEVAGPGHWNDPDYLGPQLGMTDTEFRTQFTLWTVAAAPLMIASDVRTLSDTSLTILTDADVLAVNQDPLGDQAVRVSPAGDQEVWVKDLADGSKAVVLLNRSATPAMVSTTVSEIGLKGARVTVRDLWTKQATEANKTIRETVEGHGAVLLRVSRATGQPGPSRVIIGLPQITTVDGQTLPVASAEALTAAGTVLEVSVPVSNDGTRPANDVRLDVDLPDGWQVSGDTVIGRLAPHATRTAVLTITVPEDAALGTYQLRITPTVAGAPAASGVVTVQVAPTPPEGTVNLAHHPWVIATSGWMQPTIDRSVGGWTPLIINGVTYATGIGVASPSDIRWYTGGQCTRLTGGAGVDDAVKFNPQGGTVTFHVIGDGRVLYETDVVRRDQLITFDVDLTGVRDLHPQDEQTHCTADHGRLLGIGGVSQKRHVQGRPINENAARDWVRANTDRQSLIAA